MYNKKQNGNGGEGWKAKKAKKSPPPNLKPNYKTNNTTKPSLKYKQTGQLLYKTRTVLKNKSITRNLK